jgi:hypothetical protein
LFRAIGFAVVEWAYPFAGMEISGDVPPIGKPQQFRDFGHRQVRFHQSPGNLIDAQPADFIQHRTAQQLAETAFEHAPG